MDFEAERNLIYDEAKKMATEFMTVRSGKINENDNWSDMSIRVRIIENSLSIEWRKRWWHRLKNGKRILRAQYIKKGTGFSYKKNVLLANCRDWEKQEVSLLEDRFSLLRKAWDLNNKIEKDMKTYNLIMKPYASKQKSVIEAIKLIEGNDFIEN